MNQIIQIVKFSSPQNFVSLDLIIFVTIVLQLIGETLSIPYLMNLKPVPIILLIFKSISMVNCNSNITKGLIFCTIGDILLMTNTLYFFQAGTISFLLGHICYITAHAKDASFCQLSFDFQKKFAIAITIFNLLFLIVNNYLLWQVFPNKVIFPFYAVVLSIMASTSLYRFKQKRKFQYIIGVIGALLFMTSDTIIAHTRLSEGETPLQGTIIMLLYYTGQYLILEGNSSEKQKNVKVQQ